MMQRRRFQIQLASTLALGPLLTHAKGGSDWHMPDEGEPHLRTWMAFAGSNAIWGELLSPVQKDLARVANAIARFEPVFMLANTVDLPRARKLLDPKVTLVECPVDDLWARDTGGVFVKNAAGEKAGVDFNFNGWGEKQAHRHDAQVAKFMTARAGVERLVSNLVLEGGGIEVDGAGTAIITESCVLNPNRNLGLGKLRSRLRSSRHWACRKSSGCPVSPGRTSPTATPISMPASCAPAWQLRRWTRTPSPLTTP